MVTCNHCGPGDVEIQAEPKWGTFMFEVTRYVSLWQPPFCRFLHCSWDTPFSHQVSFILPLFFIFGQKFTFSGSVPPPPIWAIFVSLRHDCDKNLFQRHEVYFRKNLFHDPILWNACSAYSLTKLWEPPWQNHSSGTYKSGQTYS